MKNAEELKNRGFRETLRTKGKCPFIRNSFKECYCMDMNSLKTDDAIYYCGKNFTKCLIYREKMVSSLLTPQTRTYGKSGREEND